MNARIGQCLAMVAVLLASTLAAAQVDKQVIWKLTDEKGRVTYVDRAPPKDYKGQVTRFEVDLNANRATLSRGGEASAPVASLPLTTPELKRVKAEAELVRARQVLEAAKKALEAGKEPGPDELQWIGKVGGGARPVPTEAYHARVKRLEDDVKAAEEAYETARKAARMAAID